MEGVRSKTGTYNRYTFIMCYSMLILETHRSHRHHMYRALVILFQGEIGPGMSSDTELAELLRQLGAEHFSGRVPRDMYAMVCVNGGPLITEAYVANREPTVARDDGQQLLPASPLAISVNVPVPQVKGQSWVTDGGVARETAVSWGRLHRWGSVNSSDCS